MKKPAIKSLLDWTPLVILSAYVVSLMVQWLSGDFLLNARHIGGLILIPLNYGLFIRNHQLGVLSLGLTLILGMLGLLAIEPEISTTTFSIGPIPVFYGQPVFLIWLVLHLILSRRYYFGIATRSYWQKLAADIKSK